MTTFKTQTMAKCKLTCHFVPVFPFPNALQYFVAPNVRSQDRQKISGT